MSNFVKGLLIGCGIGLVIYGIYKINKALDKEIEFHKEQREQFEKQTEALNEALGK